MDAVRETPATWADVCAALGVSLSKRVARLTASGEAAKLHLRYIVRDGVEKDGAKGILYDASGTGRGETFEEPRVGEKHQFRIIVSPEDADELDLTEYVRTLMAASSEISVAGSTG
jgi:type IV secretory pathway VirD2 relaxase